MTKATNVTPQFVFLTEEGDDDREEDQRRQTRGEKKADLIGQVGVPEKLIGQAEATTVLIDCRVVMEMPSEEVVTHHLDELWHLGPFRGEEMLLRFTFVPWGSARRPWRRRSGALWPVRGESRLMSR